MSDISCKKIIKNEKDIIVFDDYDLNNVLFGIIFTLVGLHVIIMQTPFEKIEEWLMFKLGFSIFVIVGISRIIGKYETITIDNKLMSVYIESRRLFVIKGKDRTIGFSEILYASIKENYIAECDQPSWDIILTLNSGEKKQIFRGENHEEAKLLLDKILAFLRNDEVIYSVCTPSEDRTQVNSLHNQTLRLERGWEG